MPVVIIDGSKIHDFDSFHTVLAEAFGFPEYYGGNMNGWIDCMTSIDSPEDGMTRVRATAADPIVLRIDEVSAMPKELVNTLNDGAAFVNWTRLEAGQPPILFLSYWMQPSPRLVSQRVRNRIIEYLELASSTEAQAEYQRNARQMSVANEVFNQWEDWVYGDPDSIAWDREVFTSDELEAMKSFHIAWASAAKATPADLPPLRELQQSSVWVQLCSSAALALEVFERRGKLPDDQVNV